MASNLLNLALTSCILSQLVDASTKNNSICNPALNSEDCFAYPFEVCDETSKTCVHKPLFPAQLSEIFAYALLPIFFAVASVGGVGGGIILLPIMIGMLKFQTKEAIVLTSVIVTESVLIRFIFFSAHTKHPERPNATEIDYNLVRAAFPIFMIGSYFGVIISVSMSDLVLAILLMTLMTFLSC